ncbi:MAG: leucine-rich repeat domain-containing protein [Ruminococcus sp.]|nr:leucine-rich repeat domain-containing protein [Ruminococcus sp.]
MDRRRTDQNVIIEEWVTSVGGSAFEKCTNLKNVILPQSVDYIGPYAFSESGLQSIVMPAYLRGTGNAVFSDRKSLESLVIPEGIAQIDMMCSNCTALKKVTLPSTLKTIM